MDWQSRESEICIWSYSEFLFLWPHISVSILPNKCALLHTSAITVLLWHLSLLVSPMARTLIYSHQLRPQPLNHKSFVLHSFFLFFPDWTVGGSQRTSSIFYSVLGCVTKPHTILLKYFHRDIKNTEFQFIFRYETDWIWHNPTYNIFHQPA